MQDDGRQAASEPEARAKYVTNGCEGSEPAFTLTRSQLEAVVEGAVARALGAGQALLVDKQALAARLQVSVAHIDHLRKRGLPSVSLGASVRFSPEDVMRWLRAAANDTE